MGHGSHFVYPVIWSVLCRLVPSVSLMADGSMLAAAKLLEPLAERVGHLEHVTQAGSITGHSKDNGSPVSQYLKFTNFSQPFESI